MQLLTQIAHRTYGGFQDSPNLLGFSCIRTCATNDIGTIGFYKNKRKGMRTEKKTYYVYVGQKWLERQFQILKRNRVARQVP